VDLNRAWARLGAGTLLAARGEDDDELPSDSLFWWNASTKQLSAPLAVAPGMLVQRLVSIDAGHALVCTSHRYERPAFTDYKPLQAFVLALRDGMLVRETAGSDRLRSALLAASVRGPVEGLGKVEDESPAKLPPVFFNAATCQWEMKVLPDFMRDAQSLYIKHYRLPDGRILVGHADWFSPALNHRTSLAAPLLWNEGAGRWDSIENTAQEGTDGDSFRSYGIDGPVVSVTHGDFEDAAYVEFLDLKTLHWGRSRQTLHTDCPHVAPLSTGQTLVFLRHEGKILLVDPMRESIPGRFAYGHTRWGEVRLKGGGLFLAGGGTRWYPNNRPEMLAARAMRPQQIAPLPMRLGYLSGIELADKTILVFGGLPPGCGPDGFCGKQTAAQPSYRYFPQEDRWELVPNLAIPFAKGQFWDSGNSDIVSQWPRNDALLRRNGDFVYLDSGYILGPSGDDLPLTTMLSRWRPGMEAPQALAPLRDGRTYATLLELADARLAVIGGLARHAARDRADACFGCAETVGAAPPEFARTTEIFDDKTKQWVSGPIPHHAGGRAVRLANGRIFKLSMKDWGAESGYRAEVADAAFKTWSELPDFPLQPFHVMDVVAVGNRVLVLPEEPYRKIVIWNDAKRTWSLSDQWTARQPLAFTPLDGRRALARFHDDSFEMVPVPH